MATMAILFPNKRVVGFILSFYVFVFCFLPAVFCAGHLQKLHLPDPGPDCFAFDSAGQGPYTGVADGRIFKYKGPKVGFVEYGYSKADRSARFCDGTNSTALAKACGRPSGLGFYYKTGELYVADDGVGLVVIGPKGGAGKVLASGAEKVPFGLPDGLDVDQNTGIVYFTDATARYTINEIPQIIASGDSTGRLLKYNPRTKKVTVLLRRLAGPAGVAISKDRSYLLVTENLKSRVWKYWLKGPKANTAHVLLNVSGSPAKIVRNNVGDFWLAMTVKRQVPTPRIKLQGLRINGYGKILETITFNPGFDSSMITEVHEHKGALYLGSLYVGYVGVYRKF
ncbi:protein STRICTOSIDINE SYNTHASE-LIKE 12-like [Coffea arabica]|uniref:Protein STRICTOSIDINE SYNTHASE-LIKE 12-like n=1 Tax=Coffea arabica TaxID=13443 RepID=A0A6P6XD83_COFAR|nr:protein STRICTOSIDINE SYNTHASE-LIKE 12-like [Coffea arabica]